MAEYQVIARRFRPKNFSEVIGQEATVTTLKNAILKERLATAYLFCGSRGTGKTTLARVFAKALNCANPSGDCEPCNTCNACREIAAGISLDVLEIDGASHRGIDDIRQINETVSYAPSSGKYKIYIIDEVHMLTKEAFNALLKTLEEPPPKVKFFFATTEPHKVLPTILSRCQRFNLNRIPLDQIVEKLRMICQTLNITAHDSALRLIAKRAEGGLRDAESLLDQIIAFQEGSLDEASTADILGLMPREALFTLDKAGKEGQYSTVFDVTEKLFSQGKDFVHFIEMMMDHIRTILMVKLGNDSVVAQCTEQEKQSYKTSAAWYTPEQCMTIMEMLVDAQSQVRFAPSPRFALEALLFRILKTHTRVPIEFLVKRLSELENRLSNNVDYPEPAEPAQMANPTLERRPEPKPEPRSEPKAEPKFEPKPENKIETKATEKKTEVKTAPKTEPKSTPKAEMKVEKAPPPPPHIIADAEVKPQHYYDTKLQFAAIELGGSVQLKKILR